MQRKQAKKLVIVLVGVIIIAAVYVVSAAAPQFLEDRYYLPSTGQPHNWTWGKVTPSETEIFTDIDICNPNWINITLKKEYIDGTITFNGLDIGKISLEEDTKLEKRVLTTATFLIEINNCLIPECWQSHIARKEKSKMDINISFTFKFREVKFLEKYFNGTIWFNTTLLEELDGQLEGMTFPICNLLTLGIESAESRWIDDTETAILHKIDLRSLSPVPIPFPPTTYTIKGNKIVLGEGEKPGRYWIRHCENKTLTLTTTIKDMFLDDWWVSHFEHGKKTEVVVNASIKFFWWEWEKRFATEISYDPLDELEGAAFEPLPEESQTTPVTLSQIVPYMLVEVIAILLVAYYIWRKKFPP